MSKPTPSQSLRFLKQAMMTLLNAEALGNWLKNRLANGVTQTVQAKPKRPSWAQCTFSLENTCVLNNHSEGKLFGMQI